MCIIIRN